ncbi:MAG: ABC transporter ATP-binding protein [Desulfobulbaceae bacterium]|nr:ABC transporter ATP-binding protein [Desulfobulbaceae bacterium]
MQENAQPLFQAQGIEKIFNGRQQLAVLKGVDLTLDKGEMVAIVGTSGTGKTTLLHILGALDKPTAGTLLHNGKDIFAQNESELSAFRNKTIGFVFQFHHLLPEFTALENIMMPLMIAGENKKQIIDQASDLLKLVGLADRSRHKAGELSGGEQQRVALARALVMKPALLLADEPTGNLDPKTGDTMFELICELNRSYSLTTVMVTHNHRLANQLNRCLTLEDGKLHP